MTVPRWLTAGLVLVFALATSLACQGSPAPSQDTASSRGQAAGGAVGGSGPRRGGTLIVVTSADPSVINPAITSGNVEHVIGCVPYQGLVYIDASYNPQPQLAESWQVSPDNLTYTIKLRQGVQWHDGRPLTAEDVKFSFEQVMAKYHPRSQTLYSKLVQSVETPDPYTVVVTLAEV